MNTHSILLAFLVGICKSPVDPPNKGPVMLNVVLFLLNELSCCQRNYDAKNLIYYYMGNIISPAL